MVAQQIRVSAHVVIVENGRLLLCRLSAQTDDPGKWTLPGGGLDFGEAPEVGAHRELIEETGLEIEITGLLGVTSRALPANERRGDLHWVRVLYTGRVTGGSLTAEKDGSTDLAQWFQLDEVNALDLVELAEEAILIYGGP